MSKILLVGVAAAAYVLGAKAGRERYQQITNTAQRWWNDPRVQKKRSQATETVKDKAPEAKQKLSGAAKHAADKAKSDSPDDPATDGLRTSASRVGTSTSGATKSG